MNKILTTLTLLLLVNSLFGQNRSNFHHIIKKAHIESHYLPLVYKDKNGKVQNVTVCSPKLDGIITLDKGVPVIDFWAIIDSEHADKPNCISKNTELGRFELDLSRKTVGDPTKYVIVPFTAWTFGVGTTPFRYRPKADSSSSTVSSNLGLSISYGKTWGVSKISPRSITNLSFTIGPFLGLSSVDLKKSTVKNPSTWKTDRTNVAFSYGINAIVARNNLGLVFSLGFDKNLGQDSNKWSYQNKPWFGLGINTNLGIF
ncbi:MULTISPECIES: hypothetical protein [Emticicia]|uniref:hypothetical protein n=1 Tax=Emticicia TaxID=312278 RepID=UPI0007D8BDBD|nr:MULTISPECIES: hypothetical protein [Emticicia]